MQIDSKKPDFSLSTDQARRILLRAQGFDGALEAVPRRRDLTPLVKRLGLLQIDSVNVLVRAHYLPLFSRLGIYSREHLDELSYKQSSRKFFEYWGHEASLIPLEYFRLFRWRMRRAEEGHGVYGSLVRLARSKKQFIATILAEVKDRGPTGAGELERALLGKRPAGKRSWWGWSDTKRALEWLFWTGKITTAYRVNFERIYDLTERAFPNQALEEAELPADEAQRQLVLLATRALGVGTESDLRDYFRLGVAETRQRLNELVAQGDLLRGEVRGWRQPVFSAREIRVPRTVKATGLISPFDPLVWERARTERLFNFRYRIEIYTPAARREHGYYVLPFLHHNRLVGRVDLKAERVRSVLEVRAAHAEPGTDSGEVAHALRPELERLAIWLGLSRIDVQQRGNLAKWLTF
jgi:uncharacterized protein